MSPLLRDFRWESATGSRIVWIAITPAAVWSVVNSKAPSVPCKIALH